MPRANRDGCSIYYEFEEGPPDEPTVAFVGDLGLGAWQWGWQYAALAGPYGAVVFDARGCGRSDAPAGPYSMDDLVGDLEAVLVDAGVRKAHLVGCGLGGFVALAAARRTNRARSLALIGTAASGGDYDPNPLEADPDDPDALRASTEASLSAAFAAEQPEVVDSIVEWRAAEDAGPSETAAQRAALDGFDAEPLYELTLPALVVHGGDDALVPIEAGRRLAEGLPRGDLLDLGGAGHLCHVERSRTVNDELLGFFESTDAS